VVALSVVVVDVLPDRVPKVAFAERYDLVQTLRLDRQYEPFGVGIEVRTPRWQP